MTPRVELHAPSSGRHVFWGTLRMFASLGMLWLCANLAGRNHSLLGQSPPPADAEVIERYRSAMEAFGRGEFPTAISTFEDLISRGVGGPALENVRFSLAAALYNAKDTKKALQKFQEFAKSFPQNPKAQDALLAVANCQIALGDNRAASLTLTSLIKAGGANKDQALVLNASILRSAGKLDEAASLVKPIISAGIRAPETVRAAMLLASIEASKGNREGALQIATLLHGRSDLIENPAELNALAYEIGDVFLKEKDYPRALQSYALIWSREEMIALQQSRGLSLAKQIEGNIALAKSEPTRVAEIIDTNNGLRNAFESAKVAIADLEKSPKSLISLRLRQARCYQEAGRHWEAVLLLESALDSREKEGMEELLFSLGSSHAEIGNREDSLTALNRLLHEFPSGKTSDSARYLQGVQLLQNNRYEEAATAFLRLLENSPKSPIADQAQFLLANACFALAQFSKAIEHYHQYQKSYPKGDHIEESGYRISLCHLSLGDYAKALESFESYTKKHPNGTFAGDASYRIAACYYAAKQYDTVIELCDRWETAFGLPSLRGEVFALKGDALAAKEMRLEATLAYRQAVELGSTDEIVQYALFEANKQLQRLGHWEQSAEMFKAFIASRPEHPAVVGATFWLTKAMVKQGKTEEAKRYLADQIVKYLPDQTRDAVEQLLSQLAQLCSKRPNIPSSVTPPPSPIESKPQTAYDPVGEMSRFLDPNSLPDTPLVRARIAFVRSELARLTKHPEEADKIIDSLCDHEDATGLSASLLAHCGDRLLERGNLEKATRFYRELMKAFPKSELLDYAYNGLGQIALREGNFEGSIRLFEDAIDKAGASTKLKDVTLGKGRALLMMGKLDEARPIFEQVASTREWRGESTAEAVFLIGEVLFKKNDYAAAVQYFQRVFVAYQRYLPTVAKAYLRAADCFEHLGAPEKAQAHLRELLRKDKKFSQFPESEIARKRLNLPEAR